MIYIFHSSLFVFHELHTFKMSRPLILQKVPQLVIVWYTLMIGLRLWNLTRRNNLLFPKLYIRDTYSVCFLVFVVLILLIVFLMWYLLCSSIVRLLFFLCIHLLKSLKVFWPFMPCPFSPLSFYIYFETFVNIFMER